MNNKVGLQELNSNSCGGEKTYGKSISSLRLFSSRANESAFAASAKDKDR